MLDLSCSIMKKTTYMRKARCVVCSSLLCPAFIFFTFMGCKVSKSREVKRVLWSQES